MIRTRGEDVWTKRVEKERKREWTEKNKEIDTKYSGTKKKKKEQINRK